MSRVGGLIACIAVASAATAQQDRPAVKPIAGAPEWLKEYKFPQADFTFVRIQYSDWRRGRGRGAWATDYPDADLNFSDQLRALTTLNVDPEGKVLKLTDDALPNYPFLYLVEPGGLMLDNAEVKRLRSYLLGGGFLMVDDFWGDQEWKNFEREIKRVFPNRPIVDLPLDHKIFHCVFDLKQRPQVPSIAHYISGYRFERADAKGADYRGISDKDGRLMVVICHNTDLADGWERSDEHPRYYKEMSEKLAYPMGVNIVFYALTQGK